MSVSVTRTSRYFLSALVAVVAAAPASAQPDPYRAVAAWVQAQTLTRALGSVSFVDTDRDGNVWVAERCGQNSCVGQTGIAPILLLDAAGRLVREFGADMFVWPHGLHVDFEGNVWVTDGRTDGERGFQVFKFSPGGELLMTLGEAGVSGAGAYQFSGPTDVVVSPTGDIFVADGHEPESNNRIMRFTAAGRFVGAWGGTGSGPGQFLVPHAIAMDSAGRVFVADRDNNRVQVFNQDGRVLEEWMQFGRPSGIHITADDTIYVSDNQSNDARNPGVRRGIRVGSARDGALIAFIPDPNFDPAQEQETSAHGVTADSEGNVYGAEVWSQTVKKYVRR